ncbi:hypothetical protein SAMN05661080_04521 [Modestobacter sp. DSM 44400]|uniref:hypothetical protein n=1 Tax=Modestobacter sp. DSM 44400 TaxID=1550230 RepID=UPI0008943092|nr:hypothetical protein [Modestobacter sp. DSM 44400]SDY76071.1 hypothetical protein SAMN05661080_04521 [Modestobacter sp. DSM 44400]
MHVTCTGSFDQEAGSYLDNLVVRAALNMDRSLAEANKRAASGQPVPADDLPNV